MSLEFLLGSCVEALYLRTKLLWIGADLAVTDAHVRGALPATDIVAESSLQNGLARLRSSDFDAAVLSLAALDCSGDRALDEAFRTAPNLPLIVHHRDGSIDDVIHLTRRGVFHILLGEVDPASFAEAAGRAFRDSRARRACVESAPWRHFLIGQSRSMLQICEIVQLVAAKRCTILIGGETGTGKEVIAKAIHAASNRAAHPLVSVNCTALPASLIETELFGHAKGAFTGAHSSRIGRFEQAHRGSIFLDEIGDLPLEAQAKLLRVLQEQEFQRVGSSETVRVDVRVIAASNVDLEQAVRERRFREDLYYRLNVVPLHLSPLRERREDIPLLIQHFLDKNRLAENAPPKQIAPEAVLFLQQMDWPGNVRQLEHAVQMAFALSGERSLLCPNDFVIRRPLRGEPQTAFARAAAVGAAAAPVGVSSMLQLPQQGLDFDEVVGAFELSLLDQALNACNGNKARAADLLKIKRTTLLAKLKSLKGTKGIDPASPDDKETLDVWAARPADTGVSRGVPHSSLAVLSNPVVLVFDPDPPVRKLIASSLTREGFRVLAAASTAETLELADCWKGRISLFLAPIESEDLAASCRRAIPDLSVIHFSERQAGPAPSPSQTRTRILPRPFSTDDLLDAVKELNANLAADSAAVDDFAVLGSSLPVPGMAMQEAGA
jgi:two-component system nitrogen regulation response regulator GlnG